MFVTKYINCNLFITIFKFIDIMHIDWEVKTIPVEVIWLLSKFAINTVRISFHWIQCSRASSFEALIIFVFKIDVAYFSVITFGSGMYEELPSRLYTAVWRPGLKTYQNLQLLPWRWKFVPGVASLLISPKQFIHFRKRFVRVCVF